MNFKFEIGEKTDKGIIKSRFYEEWKNRNGGSQNGLFYIMDNSKSFNEILINIETKDIEAENINQLIGKKIKIIRSKIFKQTEFAKLLDVSRSSVSNIEVGRHTLTVKMLQKICKELNCKSKEILPF